MTKHSKSAPRILDMLKSQPQWYLQLDFSAEQRVETHACLQVGRNIKFEASGKTPAIALAVLARKLNAGIAASGTLEKFLAKVEQETCHYCGSVEAPISGEDVHPGYDGYPICPSCKGC